MLHAEFLSGDSVVQKLGMLIIDDRVTSILSLHDSHSTWKRPAMAIEFMRNLRSCIASDIGHIVLVSLGHIRIVHVHIR